MTKTKKKFDELLQEVRSKHRDTLRYQKRKQEEKEAKEELKNYENRKSER